MNISVIADMIRQDSGIAADVPAFLARMNAPFPSKVERRIVVETVEEEMTIALIHGGEATAEDVRAAMELIYREALEANLDARFEKVYELGITALKTQDPADMQTAIDAFVAPLNPEGGK